MTCVASMTPKVNDGCSINDARSANDGQRPNDNNPKIYNYYEKLLSPLRRFFLILIPVLADRRLRQQGAPAPCDLRFFPDG